MPVIKTYDQQIAAPDATIRSPGNEAAGVPGEALSKAGKEMAQFGVTLNKADHSEDVSTSHTKIAKIQNDYHNRIKAEIQTGTIDAKKLYSDYQETINAQMDQFKTTSGKDYFQKLSENLGTSLVKTAGIAQAQHVGKMAVQDIDTTMNLNADTLQKAPASFDTVLKQSMDMIDSHVHDGTLNVDDAEKLKSSSASALAQNAVRGWAHMSAETAKTLLDNGVYDKYLGKNGDVKNSLYNQIKVYASGEKTDTLNADRLKKIADKKTSDAWEHNGLQELEDGTMTSKKIIDAPVSPAVQQHWMRMLDQQAKKQYDNNPVVEADLTRRMLLPDGAEGKINDMSELYDYVKPGGINITTLKKLSQFQVMAGMASGMRAGRKDMVDKAASQITKPNPMTGMPEPVGHENMSHFTSDMLLREDQVKKDGKDPSTIYDPNSKDYFGNSVLQYKPKATDYLNSAKSIKGVDVPEEEKRKPNESPAEWVARRKANKK